MNIVFGKTFDVVVFFYVHIINSIYWSCRHNGCADKIRQSRVGVILHGVERGKAGQG